MALIVDTVTDRLKRLSRALKDTGALNKVIANATSELFKKHFVGMAMKERNKFGKPPTFWKRMRSSVRPFSGPSMAGVEMSRPVAQRYYGGTIKPTGGKRWLTIPLTKTAYGRSARSFEDLYIYTSHIGNKFLARDIVKRKKKKTVLEYLLKKSVTQKGDKNAIPSKQKIKETTASTLKSYLDRKAMA